MNTNLINSSPKYYVEVMPVKCHAADGAVNRTAQT